MSRDFSKNNSNWLSLGINKVGPLINGAAQVSFHAWLYPDTFDSATVNDNRILNTGVADSSSGVLLGIDATGANKVIRVGGRSVSTDGFQALSGVTNVPTTTYSAIGGVLDFTNNKIYIYLNGVLDNSGTVTFGNATYTQATPTTNNDAIGTALTVTTPNTTEQVDGRVGEVAIWNTNIGVAAFTQLAGNTSPLRVATGNLKFYMPLLGTSSPEPDMASGLLGTITGSLPAVAGPIFGRVGKVTLRPAPFKPGNAR